MNPVHIWKFTIWKTVQLESCHIGKKDIWNIASWKIVHIRIIYWKSGGKFHLKREFQVTLHAKMTIQGNCSVLS